MSTVAKRLTTLFFGTLLIATGFIIDFDIIRPILVIVGIILLTISNSLERNHKKVFLPLFFIMFLLFMIALDYLVVGAFKKTPIFSYSIVKTSDSTVYNSIGYRVWVCNDKDKSFKVDTLYKLGYYCSSYNITAEQIDNILPKLYDNFELYKDAYIKVVGRISNIKNNQEFYMQIYDNNKFDDKYTLDVLFNFPSEEISKHYVLDEVTIIGKVESISDNTIKLVDSNFMTQSNLTTDYSSYSFDVNSNIYCAYDKELWFQEKDHVFYKSCINSVDIIINKEKYLSYAIKNDLITLDELKDLAEGFLSNSKDSSKIYIYNNFRLLECNKSNNSDLIIGKTTMSFDDGYCAFTDNSEVGV